MNKYTDEVIKGITPKYVLPPNFSLILEGGGMRGFYSAGVLDALMEAGIMFPYIVGVSAGAANALSYISGQYGRNKSIIENYASHSKYIGVRNIFKEKSILGIDFIFREIPQEHSFFDWDMFKKSEARFLTGTFDCETGKSIWFEKEELNKSLKVLIASCSIPFASPVVHYQNKHLLDGGIVDAIPIHKSIEDGNTFHVIVLTRNKEYRKTSKNLTFAKLFYSKYPKLVEALKNRHTTYNAQLELCEELEKQGKAIIIRPTNPLEVTRLERKKEKLLALFYEGKNEASYAINTLQKYLKR